MSKIQYLKFSMLTGVSKFSKTGIFSGLNNLKDITLDSRYSALCGYTQEDLENVFSSWLENFDPDEVRERRYAEKYRADTRQLHEVGIVFDPETRNIDLWETD